MFRLAAFHSRRLLAAAVLACLAVAAVPASAEPLVSAEWLKGHLSDPSVVVLDVRSSVDGGGAEAYARAHIPGAVHSDYDKAGWRVTRNGVPLMLPSSAARIYWTLKIAGHPAVSILDGGFAAWQAAAYPVESGKRTPSPRIFTVKFDQSLLAEMQQVERNEQATLVDARPASFFEGKVKAPASKAYGHIPGALNVDSASFYDPATNRLRPPEQLAAIAQAIPSGPVVAYCNTGHWAATDWFVLSAILHRPDVRLYDGSMVEWTADAHRPVASSRTRFDDLKKALGLGS
jgi:thiosulfate/3-mercaptopyruvate sulfurtransferase